MLYYAFIYIFNDILRRCISFVWQALPLLILRMAYYTGVYQLYGMLYRSYMMNGMLYRSYMMNGISRRCTSFVWRVVPLFIFRMASFTVAYHSVVYHLNNISQ